MIMRPPGETRPVMVSADMQRPIEERAKFWIRVYTQGDWDRLVNLFEQRKKREVSPSQFCSLALGMTLDRVENVHVQKGNEVVPLELKREQNGALDKFTTELLYPFHEEIIFEAQAGSQIDEGEQKNS